MKETKTKCDTCIHQSVCMFRPHKSDPAEMQAITLRQCEDFIDERKVQLREVSKE